jgi:hypothetical protein
MEEVEDDLFFVLEGFETIAKFNLAYIAQIPPSPEPATEEQENEYDDPGHGAIKG